MTSEPDAPADGTLSTHEVCEATGATFRMIDYWTKRGYLIAAPRSRESSGAKRRYTRREASVAAMMRILVAAGIEPGAAARAGRAMVTHQVRRIALDEHVTLVVSSLPEVAP